MTIERIGTSDEWDQAARAADHCLICIRHALDWVSALREAMPAGSPAVQAAQLKIIRARDEVRDLSDLCVSAYAEACNAEEEQTYRLTEKGLAATDPLMERLSQSPDSAEREIARMDMEKRKGQ